MGNFMDYIDEPRAIRAEKPFKTARRGLANMLRHTPEEKLGDSTDIMLIEGMRPRYVGILLLNSEESVRGERTGIIDVEVRAPFSHSMGRIVLPEDMQNDATAKEGDLQLWLGEEWSEELLQKLSPDERVAAIRHAYSCRAKNLYNQIAKGRPDMGELHERYLALEDLCAAAVRRIRSTVG